MIVQTWGQVLITSLQNLWLGVVEHAPKIIIAILLFIIGWLIGALIEKAIEKFIKAIKLDELLNGAGLGSLLRKGGFKLNSGLFFGAIVKWFIIIAFLVTSLDIVGLAQVNNFLTGVILGYLPQVFVAALVLVIAIVIANAAERLVVGSARAADIKHSNFLGAIARWAVWVFGIIIALSQLGIAEYFLQVLYTAIIAMIAVAGALAFGLGGRDAASKAIDKMKEQIK